MKRIKRKIRKLIYNILGISELEKRISQIEELTEIGVDVGITGKDSWAVICIKGKRDYVSFVDLRGKDLREIQHLFSKYNRVNKLYDFPGMMF